MRALAKVTTHRDGCSCTRHATFRMDRRGRCEVAAFTIVELLVVIAIIGVLVSILLPAVNAVRESARRTENTNNVKQIGLAIITYEEANSTYPPLVKFPQGVNRTMDNLDRAVSWAFELLPFLEQQNIYDRLDPTAKTNAFSNQIAMTTPVPTYANPRRRDARATSPFMTRGELAAGALLDYAVNGGVVMELVNGRPKRDDNGNPIPQRLPNNPQGITMEFPYQERFDPNYSGPFHLTFAVPQAAVKDGLGNTLAVGDRWIGPPLAGSRAGWNDLCGLAGDSLPTLIRYANPDEMSATGLPFPLGNTDTSLAKFGSDRGSDACFSFLDGHVVWIDYDVDAFVFRNLASINDGVPVPPL